MDGPGFEDTRKDGDQHCDADHKEKVTAYRRTHVDGVFRFVTGARGDVTLINQARSLKGLECLGLGPSGSTW
jgi:hypothetical protein